MLFSIPNGSSMETLNGRNFTLQFYALRIVGTGDLRLYRTTQYPPTHASNTRRRRVVPLGTKRGAYSTPRREVTICISAASGGATRRSRTPSTKHASDEERERESPPPPAVLCIILRIARIIVPPVPQKRADDSSEDPASRD